MSHRFIRFELKDTNELSQLNDFLEQQKQTNNNIVLTKLQIDEDIILEDKVASSGVSEHGFQSITVQIVCSIDETQLASLTEISHLNFIDQVYTALQQRTQKLSQPIYTALKKTSIGV